MNDSRQADFTIFAHVYYPDVWEEMIDELDGIIRQPFDLVITRPAGSRRAALPKNSYLRLATELEVDNRGRDILPFLTAFKQKAESPSDIGLKLHTKRSPHRGDGDGWRRFLLGSLLQTEEGGELSGHKLLATESRIGLIAPQAHLLPLGGRTSINESIMLGTLQRMEASVDISALEGHRFPAGSMFWFRRAALRKAIEVDFADQFARECGQLDGTAAHAFERLFAFIAEREGFIAASMENVEPILRRRGTPLSRAELSELINDSLLGDNPFALPLADFWRRHPSLLKCAHAIYARMPKATVRLLRRSIGR